MDIDLTALRDELATDPATLGYTGADAEDAEKLSTPGLSGHTLLRDAIPMGEVYAEVEWITEWLNLTAAQREGFRQLTSTDTLDASSPRVRDAIEAIFGTGSVTWANLAALATRDASRAEQLWGRNARVTHLDVAAARRL